MITYLDIVNKVKEITDRHPQLAQFGYGALSDIRNSISKTETKDESATDAVRYPYLFLNPGNHRLEKNVTVYQFSMIVMDQTPIKENPVIYSTPTEPLGLPNFLKVQSDCMLYIKDVLAELYYENSDNIDIRVTGTLTPFKERFNDWVAGATFNLEITVGEGLNACISPLNTSRIN